MKNACVMGAVALGLLVSAQPGEAGDCCAPTTVAWVEQTVTCLRPEWREREVTCVVNRVVLREVVVPVKRVVMVPEFKDVTKTIVVAKLVAREVERDVVSCRMVPASVTDPCTGCVVTVCKPETVVYRVKCTVMECVPEQRDVVVRICCPKPVEQIVQCCKLVCELKPETVTRRECYCVLVPHQVTVRVPVCVPACK